MLCFCRLEIDCYRTHNTLECVLLDPIQWLTEFIHVSGLIIELNFRILHV